MLYAIIAVLAVILDQIVKYLVESRVLLDAIGSDVVRLIPGFIHITNVHNYGAAFSFLEGARWFFVVLCILFVLVVVYVIVKDIINTPLARWMAVMVVAGAVGNCIDRIVCGYVVDMFEFEFFRFPVFNVADIYITLGAIIFCVCVLLEKPKPAQPLPTEPELPTAAPAAPEKPAVKKPLLRKHQKVEIPDFPKHAPLPAAPAIDPNDPFAEWEKRANAQSVPAPETAAAPDTSVKTVYTQPEARQAAPAPAPAAPETVAAPEGAAAPMADAPKAPDEYSLDDILAEFKDL